MESNPLAIMHREKSMCVMHGDGMCPARQGSDVHPPFTPFLVDPDPLSPLRPSVTLLFLTRNEWKEFMSFAEEVKKTEKVRESWAFVVLSCFNSSKDLLTLLFDTPAAPLVIGVAAAVFPSG